MPFAETFAPFFATSDFGSAATLDGAAVNGIFDNGYSEVLGVSDGTAPSFMLATADASGVAQGSTLVIGAAHYTVRGVEPDGTGVTLLRLQEA